MEGGLKGNRRIGPSLSGVGCASLRATWCAQVIPAERSMVALNGRIHEISGPLSVPAPSIFALLSSHPELEEWANWVQQVKGRVVVGKEAGLSPRQDQVARAHPWIPVHASIHPPCLFTSGRSVPQFVKSA